MPGYGAYWNDSYPDGKIVTEINGVKWSFSNEMFAEFVCNLEIYSKWKYSGESELLLVDLKDGILSFDRMMQFHLDNMFRDNVIYSVHQFFEQLFRVCRDKETLSKVSNTFGLDKAKQITKGRILDKVPVGLGDILIQEKYFCVKKYGSINITL